jgi:hypothetical protein
MKVHLLDGQSGRLWCGTRKLRKDDLIATTARFEHIEEQMLDDKLVVDDPDKGTFLRDPEFLGPGSIDYYIAGGDAGSVCADCLSALERERLAASR